MPRMGHEHKPAPGSLRIREALDGVWPHTRALWFRAFSGPRPRGLLSFLRKRPPECWVAFEALREVVLRTGSVPRLWQRATITLLDEGQQEARPIALLSMAWRTGARAVAGKLKGVHRLLVRP